MTSDSKRKRCCTTEFEAKRTRGDRDTSVSKEAENFPRPSSHLAGSEELKELSYVAKISLQPSLSPEAYEEAVNNPLLCNLQLKTASADPAELESFGAFLPAADAYTLSPVIRTRLQRWPNSTEEGRAELDLQIDVSQEILNSVVGAVYGKELLVNSSNAESLLLVADYLQMEWLTKAVKCFVEERLLSTPSLEVCKLAAVHPQLGVFSRAVMQLMVAQPKAATQMDLILMASKSQRGIIFAAAAQLLPPAQLLDYIISLARHPEVRLLQNEASLLAGLGPSSETLPRQSWFEEDSDADTLAAWGSLYMQRRGLLLTEDKQHHSPGKVVWDIGLQGTKKTKFYSPEKLSSPDGRRFQLATVPSKEKDKVGLFVCCAKGELEEGDRFMISAVGSLDTPSVLEVPKGVIDNLGVCGLLSVYANNSRNTVCEGKYLPVVFQMLHSAKG